MIPKIIHFTWFSNEKFPQKVKECMNSWKEILPDYQFIHWDLKRIAEIDSDYLTEAIAEKKWAFASDYVRLYAIYNYGGIYLDTDVFLYKSFNSLLNSECFIGRENSWHFYNGATTVCYLTSHCFGAVKNHPFIKETLDYYNSIHFIKSTNTNIDNTLRLDQTIIPYTQSIIARKYGYNWNLSADYKQELSNNTTIYPSVYFDCVNSKNSFCKHLATGSWRSEYIQFPTITLFYKIEWRIIALLKFILKRFKYTIVKTS